MVTSANIPKNKNRFGIASDFPRYAEVRVLISGFLRLVDTLILVLTAVFTFWLRNDQFDLSAPYLVATSLSVVFLLIIGHVVGLYQFRTKLQFTQQFGAATLALTAVMAALAMAGYLTKTADIFSRLWLVTWFFIAYASIVVARIIAVRKIDAWRSQGRLQRRVAVVGSGEKCAKLLEHLKISTDENLRLIGVYSDVSKSDRHMSDMQPQGYLSDLVTNASQLDIDEIIVAVPGHDHDQLSNVMRELRAVPADVSFCPDTIGLTMPILGIEEVHGLGLLQIYRRPISGWNRVLKGIEDRVLASIALIILSPLFLVIAIAIKIDSPGSILFRQKRLGFNNNTFVLYKFRSMYKVFNDDQSVPQAQRGDPRVTRIGRLLRRTSLDELPQLLNVLKGEMSLVGPRPHAIAHNEFYAKLIDQYLGRHRVKPGITGWAQIHGYRGETETVEKMRARVEYDLSYIDNWSLWFDLRIILMTPFTGLIHRNAY